MMRDPPPHMSDLYPSSPGASSSAAARPSVEEIEREEDVQVDEIFRDLSIKEIMEELETRFLYNLPKVETNLVRLYWQAEQAHWFYEDYIRPLNPDLPTMSQKIFTHTLVKNNPLYRLYGGADNDDVWDAYCSYKKMVPCCGGILINSVGDKCLMVRGWKSNAGWCFPRGKINSQEQEVDCAIREVQEETGFDLTGLVDPDDRIQTQIAAQVVTMFIVGGIDENTPFETQTRMEIGAIEWVNLVDLPTWTYQKKSSKVIPKKGKKFYNVTPFVGPLKQWLLDRGFSLKPAPKPPHSMANPPNPMPKPGSVPRVLAIAPSVKASKLQAPQPHPSVPPDPSVFTRLSPRLTSSSSADSSRDQQTTALDSLFTKFVHKQEQDLEKPPENGYGAEDGRAGLQRLSNKLESVRLDDRETEARRVAEKDEASQREEEEDALASLLGTIALPTPAPLPFYPKQPLPTNKARELMAVLNVKVATSLSSEPMPTPTTLTPSAGHPGINSHHATLLGVLSASKHTPSVSAANQKLPLSPEAGVPSSEPKRDDSERSQKQRALLERIVAGIGDDFRTTIQPTWDHTAGQHLTFPSMPLSQPIGPAGDNQDAHQHTLRTHSNGIQAYAPSHSGFRGDIPPTPPYDAPSLTEVHPRGMATAITALLRPMPLEEQQRSLLGTLYGNTRPPLLNLTSYPTYEDVSCPAYPPPPQFPEHRRHNPDSQQARPTRPLDYQYQPFHASQSGLQVRPSMPYTNSGHMSSTQIAPRPFHHLTNPGFPTTAALYTRSKTAPMPPPGQPPQPYAHPTHLALQMAVNAPGPGSRMDYHYPVPRPPNGAGGPGGALGMLMEGNGEPWGR